MFEVHGIGDRIRMQLEAPLAELLRNLNAQYRELLGDKPADDPVIGRLFPSAYDDPEDQEKYVELVGDELERGKIETARAVAETLGHDGHVDATLTREEVEPWLRWLSDVRLAIAIRIGVTQEQMLLTEPEPNDPHAAELEVMDWLGWLQQCLVDEMTI